MKAKHPKQGERDAADEVEYDDSLRREEGIKTEVIVEQRDAIEKLLVNQERTMATLIQMGDLVAATLGSLRVYREHVLTTTRANLTAVRDRETYCVPGCRRHAWDAQEGWRRAVTP
jgi:tagatose-1,6-bisphosphate aldolase